MAIDDEFEREMDKIFCAALVKSHRDLVESIYILMVYHDQNPDQIMDFLNEKVSKDRANLLLESVYRTARHIQRIKEAANVPAAVPRTGRD